MKNKHRIKQGLSLLLVGALTFTNVGTALPAFAEDAPATPETASAATLETAEANVLMPNLSQITENLYDDLPDAPIGSYLGSMGLPVATGETKIGISAWVSDLYDGVDAHMDADALNADENTVTIGKTPGTDYAIVPLLAQVEYPADGAVSEIVLPDGVELLSYFSTDYEPIPADEQEQTEILHQTYSEQSAAATGLYVKASADFTAQLVYMDSDGSSQSKSIHVQISEDAAPTQMYADTGDDGIAAYAAGPTPPYTTPREEPPAPTPVPTPQPTPAATPAPTPAPTPHKVQTLPQTGDGFPLLAIVVVSLASATGIVLLTVKQKNALKETSDEEDADESADR